MVFSPANRRVKRKPRNLRRNLDNNRRYTPRTRLLIEELEARTVPSITASGTAFAGTEGSSFTGVVATFTDSDPSPPVSNFTTSITWGDGTTSVGTVQATANGFQVTGSHSYADEGTQSVVVTINDVDGSSATANSTAQVADSDAVTATGYHVTPTEGQALNGIVATFSDATYSVNSAGDFAATIDWGDGSSSSGTITSQSGVFVVRGTHTFADEGSDSITVTIRDGGEGVAGATTTSTAVVGDATLQVTGTPFTGTEGQVMGTLLIGSGGPVYVIQVANLTDANAAAQYTDYTLGGGQIRIDWGDGTFLDYGYFLPPQGGNNAIPIGRSHVYAEPGSYTVTVTVTDRGGSQASGMTTASIADGALTPTPTPVNAVEGIAFSGELAQITDANPDATLKDFPTAPGSSHPSLVIDWGDGTTSGGTISQPDGFGYYFEVDGNHTYSSAGSYTIKATVTDIDGSTTTATTTATVTNPAGIVGRLGENGQLWTGVSTGSSFNSSLWGSLDPSITWVDVVSGDFNGDGLTDLAARDAATGNWWVAVSTGSSFTVSQWGAWYAKVSWTDVQVGDFTGDGKMDIIGRPAATGDWWVSTSTGSSFTNSLWARWDPKETWVDVKVGDFNGDGKADITGRDLNTGAWWTGLSTGSNLSTTLWAVWSTGVTWVDVQVGDFNGDGKADITGRAKESGQWWTGISTGSGFSTSLWATWDPTVTWVDVKVGDFNGDGRADIIGRDLATGNWWVGLSEGFNCPACLSAAAADVSIVSIPPQFVTTQWATWSPGFTWVDVQVGDFNGDGKADITGRALESGQWWTGVSTGSSFNTSLWATWSNNVTWADVRHGDFA